MRPPSYHCCFPFPPSPHVYSLLQARSLLLCLFCGLSRHFGMRRESRTFFFFSMQPPGLALYSTTTQQPAADLSSALKQYKNLTSQVVLALLLWHPRQLTLRRTLLYSVFRSALCWANVSERISGFRALVFVYDQQNLPFVVGSSCLFFFGSSSQCLLCLPVSFPFFRVLAPPFVGFEEARDFRFSHQTRLFEFLFTL